MQIIIEQILKTWKTCYFEETVFLLFYFKLFKRIQLTTIIIIIKLLGKFIQN